MALDAKGHSMKLVHVHPSSIGQAAYEQAGICFSAAGLCREGFGVSSSWV